MSQLPDHTPEGEVYEVFAAFEAEESLHHVGNVIAVTPELAGMYAFHLYNEWSWREMILVPRREIIPLLGAYEEETLSSTASEIYKLPIEQLDLTERVQNSLKRSGITTAGEVLDLLGQGQEAVTRICHVYGRREHPVPLAYLGRVQPANDAGLRGKALGEFGDSGWVELVAFPEEAIVRVIPEREREG